MNRIPRKLAHGADIFCLLLRFNELLVPTRTIGEPLEIQEFGREEKVVNTQRECVDESNPSSLSPNHGVVKEQMRMLMGVGLCTM
jgi:hypothetical protein